MTTRYWRIGTEDSPGIVSSKSDDYANDRMVERFKREGWNPVEVSQREAERIKRQIRRRQNATWIQRNSSLTMNG